MKIFGFFLILMLSSNYTFSRELKEYYGIGDSIRVVDSLIKIANDSVDTDSLLSKQSAKDAYAMALQIKYIKGQAEALMFMASYSLKNEEYLASLDYHFKIIDLYERNLDFDNLINYGYTRITQFFLQIKDYDLARKYLDQMFRLLPKSSYPSAKGNACLCQAKYYLALHADSLAIRSLYISIPCFQKANDLLAEAAVYKYLGDAFVQTKQYANADFAYRTSISIFSQKQKLGELAVMYTRIAHIYQILENNQKNLEYNLNALHIREKIHQPLLIASSFLNVGESYWLLGRKDSANVYLSKALNLAKQINSTYYLEAIYYELYDFANSEKRYQDALKYYKCRIEYRNKMDKEQTHSEIALSDANRSIREIEMQNDLMRQVNVMQNLQIKNGTIQTFIFELAFILLLLLILFVDTLARRNRKRKNELKVLNDRLQQEIYERIEAEGRLNRSEELHRFLAENTVDVISLLDAGLQRKYISPSCEKFYGYSQQDILGMKSPLDLVDPAYRVAVNQHLVEMFRSKKTTRYIYKALRKDGTVFWAEANINPLLDEETHEVKDLISVVRDISERMKHGEELAENARQKEYLLREIHNRVKNNFTILTSLMNMQRDESGDSELNRSLTDLQLRVRTMSLVHEQLYKNQEISTIPFDNYLQNLTMVISSAFNNNRIDLKTEIHPCQVDIEVALPLGLIINELITNAYKYAFPGNNTGTLWVRLLPDTEGKFTISIHDDGIGLPPDFSMQNTRSMGTQIVQILIQQVEAKLEVSNIKGASFRILFSPNQQ